MAAKLQHPLLKILWQSLFIVIAKGCCRASFCEIIDQMGNHLVKDLENILNHKLKKLKEERFWIKYETKCLASFCNQIFSHLTVFKSKQNSTTDVPVKLNPKMLTYQSKSSSGIKCSRKGRFLSKKSTLSSCQGQRSPATPYITVNYELRQSWDHQMKAKSFPTDTYNGCYESIGKSDTRTSGALIGVAANATRLLLLTRKRFDH
ncbi:hypothetical protein CEXT_592891 [Caerostris extrusa]|uniref:Uncharacterized protein n=1 Tax=Caerostris extrusa TaxID=172846 RepID=A0AAV4PN97_CAEEX|nr:hypothetical protein CEXT_592891 [Caerostris extrusa]